MKHVVKYALELHAPTVVREQTVTQNDAIEFVFTLLKGGEPIDMTGVTPSLAVKRRDGVTTALPGTVSGNTVTFALGSTETAKPGTVYAAVQLYGADGRVSSLPFSFQVKGDLTAAGTIPSESEATLIEVVLQDGPAILQRAEAAAADAERVAVENKTNWLDAVATVAERDTAYPSPKHGDTVRVTGTATVYRYVDGKGWVVTDQYQQSAVDALNQQLAEKVSRTELEAVKSGTPKGVFSTLADLTAAHPNGSIDIYLVSADANWYYWDGKKWTAGGVYQAAASEFRNMLVNSNVPTSVDAVTGQRLHIRPDGALGIFGGYSTTYQTPQITEGDRYYSKFELTEDSTGRIVNTTRMVYPDNTYTQSTNLNSNNNGKYTSAILIADRTALVNITVGVTTAGIVSRKNQLLVNLTKLFGKGSEPTIEEFESLLSIFPGRWFDTTNSFENMQKHILRKVVGVPPTQQFTGEDGKAYNYEFKTADGHLVFRYEEAK